MPIREHAGYWWVVGRRRVQRPGTLMIFEDGSLRLDLLSSFDHYERGDEFPSYHLIQGITRDNKHFTLEDCRLVKVNDAIPYGQAVSVSPLWAYEGVHLNQRMLEFTEATVSFDVLSTWYNVTGLGRRQRKGRGERSITYHQPSKLDFRLDASTTLRLDVEFSEVIAYRQYSIYEIVQIVIGHQPGLPVREWLRTYIEPLRNFFSLAYGSAVALTSISLASAHTLTRMLDGSRRQISAPTYFKHRYRPEVDSRIRDMLFHFQDIQTNLKDYWVTGLKSLTNFEPYATFILAC